MIEVHGLKFPDGNNVDRIRRWAVRDGLPVYQDEQICAALAECGTRRNLAIDGGAHVGLWTVRLLRRFSEVVCFEPLAENVECLKCNVPEARIFQAALSDRNGAALLSGNPYKTLGWTLTPRERKYEHSILVQTFRLDDFNFSEVDLIKLDIEGGEYEALCGARETLIRCRPVVVIEEKLDPEKRASEYLERLGMKCVYEMVPDKVYKW